MTAEMLPVVVRMPPDLYEKVKAMAEFEDRTISQTIRRAVKQYVERAEVDRHIALEHIHRDMAETVDAELRRGGDIK